MQKRVFAIGCLTLNFYMLLYPIGGAKGTLGLLMQHIMHREKAAFMRFDQKAMSIMQGNDQFARKMKNIYKSKEHAVYKASPTNDKNASYDLNPLFVCAQEDLNYCTRFLKLIKKHTSLVVCDRLLPDDLARLLFKKGCLQVHIERSGVETVDSLALCCEQILKEVKGFTVVVTSLRGMSPLLQRKLLDLRDDIVLFDFDILWDLLIDQKQKCIDRVRFQHLMQRNIVFVSTAALIDAKYEQRKEQYMRSIKVLNDFGYEPYIVESCAEGPTFFDACACQPVYTQTNDALLTNKGINEAKALKAFFQGQHCDFNEDDIIIKLTGRYYLEDDSFIRLIEDNFSYDAFAMHGFQAGEKTPYLDLYTGMFALKYRYYNHLLASFNFDHMKEHKVWFEWEVSRYLYGLAERHVPVMYVDALRLNHYVFCDSVEDVKNNVSDRKCLI